jgi:hypothetical protein
MTAPLFDANPLLFFDTRQYRFCDDDSLDDVVFSAHMSFIDLSGVHVPLGEDLSVHTFSVRARDVLLDKLRAVTSCEELVIGSSFKPNLAFSDILPLRFLAQTRSLRFTNQLPLDGIMGDNGYCYGVGDFLEACPRLEQLSLSASLDDVPQTAQNGWTRLLHLSVRALGTSRAAADFIGSLGDGTKECRIIMRDPRVFVYSDNVRQWLSAHPDSELLDWRPLVTLLPIRPAKRPLALTSLRCSLVGNSRDQSDIEYGDQLVAKTLVERYFEELPAWRSLASRSVRVAFIDTGVAIDALPTSTRARIVAARSFVPSELWFEDDSHHGTAVVTQCDAVSCSDSVRFIVAKAIDRGGIGDANRIAQAIRWSCNVGADVVNLSLGCAFENANLKSAIQEALDRNIVVTAAVGNDGMTSAERNILFPATMLGVIRVGGFGAHGQVHDRTAVNANDDPVRVHVHALCEVRGPVTPNAPRHRGSCERAWRGMSGTSFAAPQIAGIMALCISSGLYTRNSDSPATRVLDNIVCELNGTRRVVVSEALKLLAPQ